MDSTPVSLYLDLEPGAVADIEVVARVSLALAAAIKEAAFIIDPSMDIRIGLESGTEGSLSLNSWLKNLKNSKGEKITLAALSFIAITWFSGHALDWTFEQIADHLLGDKSHVESFSPEQRRELSEIVQKAARGRIAEPQVQRVYRELEHAPSIKGVGATQVKGSRPATLIPREQFSARGGHVVSEEYGITRRTRTVRERIVLVSPVLLEGTRRRWKFRSAQGEFGASVLDGQFLNDVVAGRLGLPMSGGIELDVDLETTEEMRDGVWAPIERRVLHVYDRFSLPTQGELPMGAPDPREPTGAHNEQRKGQDASGGTAQSIDDLKQDEG